MIKDPENVDYKVAFKYDSLLDLDATKSDVTLRKKLAFRSINMNKICEKP
jgi:hypothetical protein